MRGGRLEKGELDGMAGWGRIPRGEDKAAGLLVSYVSGRTSPRGIGHAVHGSPKA